LPMTITPVDPSRMPGQPRAFRYTCAPAPVQQTCVEPMAAESVVSAVEQNSSSFSPSAVEFKPASALSASAVEFTPTSSLSAGTAEVMPTSRLSAAAPEFKPSCSKVSGFLLPAPTEYQFVDEVASWSCKDASGCEIDGAAIGALDLIAVSELRSPAADFLLPASTASMLPAPADTVESGNCELDLSAPTWQRYAALLASVPADEWGPDMLTHFCAEELQEMFAQASMAEPTPLRERRDLGSQFHKLGIFVDDRSKPNGFSVRTPPTRSTSCSSSGSRDHRRPSFAHVACKQWPYISPLSQTA